MYHFAKSLGEVSARVGDGDPVKTFQTAALLTACTGASAVGAAVIAGAAAVQVATVAGSVAMGVGSTALGVGAAAANVALGVGAAVATPSVLCVGTAGYGLTKIGQKLYHAAYASPRVNVESAVVNVGIAAARTAVDYLGPLATNAAVGAGSAVANIAVGVGSVAASAPLISVGAASVGLGLIGLNLYNSAYLSSTEQKSQLDNAVHPQITQKQQSAAQHMQKYLVEQVGVREAAANILVGAGIESIDKLLTFEVSSLKNLHPKVLKKVQRHQAQLRQELAVERASHHMQKYLVEQVGVREAAANLLVREGIDSVDKLLTFEVSSLKTLHPKALEKVQRHQAQLRRELAVDNIN